jgi:hypothetical protein
MNKNLRNFFRAAALVVLVLLSFTALAVFAILSDSPTPVQAQVTPIPIVINANDFTDWADKVFDDDNSADDYTTVAYNDITQFGAFADSTNLYLLMGWDNTGFANAGNYYGGIILKKGTTYYRIYGRVTASTTSPYPPSTYRVDSIYNCGTDSTCNTSPTTICQGSGSSRCSNTPYATSANGGTSLADPWPAHGTAFCSAVATCGTLDTGIEMSIPWGRLGGAPADGTFVFMHFASYATNTANAAASDQNDTYLDGRLGDGISCANEGGTMDCYTSNPTAVRMTSFEAKTVSDNWALAGALTGALLLVGLLGLVLFSRSR